MRRVRTFSRGVVPGRGLRSWLRQGLRFVAIGGLSSVLTALLYLLMRQWFSATLANGLAVAASTVLSSQAHRLVTFAHEDLQRSHLHVQNVLVFLYYFLGNAAAINVVHALVADVDSHVESLALFAMSCVSGVGRFLLLRLWVFRRRPTRQGATASTSQVVRYSSHRE